MSSFAHTPPTGAWSLSDFDFHLPIELIAQHPAPERSSSRLLDGRLSPPQDRIFRELSALLKAGDLLVFNDTRVIKARLFGRKDSGGHVEALIERVLLGSMEVWAHLRASKSPQPGSCIHFKNPSQTADFVALVLGRCGPDGGLFHLRFPAEPLALLSQYGHVPLPPYITHSDSSDDERRYQTVFARHPGAVAAPTAALHFDEPVLTELSQRGINSASITLHVGAGTFQPVRVDNIAQHKMHSEWFEVPETTVQAITQTHAQGGRVLAVGTTTLRALESAALSGSLQSGSRETDIFITPGFEFRVVDFLLTNFHLPKSTLMMLVSAFAGYETVRALYQHAIGQQYRFFSYGDAMLLEHKK
jgi:S-adenosylmethionine:tRNA ribosyltransferase-isomerase